jgi:hypothetical protein
MDEMICSRCGDDARGGTVVEMIPEDSWIREAWLLCPPCLETV